MKTLRDHLLRRIAADGPMTIADYMSECLLNPEFGYYATRDPFGRGGDFTTAPEISQMFGELIGLALAQAWLDQGSPAPFILGEIGPGRGSCMADALRAAKIVPGFLAAAQIHLIEASPALRQIQRRTLTEHEVTWHDTIDDLPDLPLFLLANEFFDALPIRQFQRATGGWSERRIGIREGELCFGLTDPLPVAALDHRLEDTRPGDIVELCAPASTIAQAIGQRIETGGGAAIIVDYGDWRGFGDTFQALRDHAYADPLDAPGSADLTAHVDFEALALAAPCAHSRMTPQGVVLERLGIAARAQALARHLAENALKIHHAAYRRLTHPDEMGRLFKAIAFYPNGKTPPPGFET